MVAPLLKKNTLEQTQFSLTDNGFTYLGQIYSFDEVAEVRSYRVIHQTRHVPFGGTTEHDPAMAILIAMKDGKQIKVTEQTTWTSSSKQNNIDRIQYAFNYICAKTKDQRMKKYITQIERHGHFEYGGWRFVPNEQILIDIKSGNTYKRGQMRFMKSYGFIAMEPVNEGLAAKIIRKSKQEFTGRQIGISTLSDTDVIFDLLRHYFRLAWSKNP